MTADRRMPTTTMSAGERWTFFAIALLLLGNVIQAARVFDLFWEDASRFAYVVQAVPVVIYLVVAIFRRHWVPAGAALLLAFLVLNSHAQFTRLAGTLENYNSVATFVPLLTFVAFVEAGISIERTLRILLVLSTIYVISYIGLVPIVSKHYTTNSYILLDGHGGGERRLYLAAAYATFIMLFGLRANTMPMVLRASLILLGTAALWLSDTRTMVAIVLGVFALAACKLLLRPVRIAILGGVMFGMFLILLGFVFTDWNPYTAFISDSSGSYRAIEYSWVIRVLGHNWFMGVGTPGEFIQLQTYLQREFAVPRSIWIFASDLGPLGAYFQFGLIGLAGFLSIVTFCMVSPWKNSSPEAQALQMTAFACAVYGVSSPLLMMEPSAIFMTLMIAMWWRDRRPASVEAPRRIRSRSRAIRRDPLPHGTAFRDPGVD